MTTTTENDPRGHATGATYELVQTLRDGTKRRIRFDERILGRMDVTASEWRKQ